MEILRINQELLPKVKDFLKRIPSIKEIEEPVLDNASLLVDQDKIMGILSFEIFENRGLIRYFIFQKTISDQDIHALFKECLAKARQENLIELLAIALKNEIQEVFKTLGFQIISNRSVFIGEEPVRATEFDKATIMKYKVKKE